MSEIPVVWHAMENSRGIFNCTAMLNDLFDHYPAVHHYGGAVRFPHVEGAVVVVHGGREVGKYDKLMDDIEDLKWVLLIFLGDEEASFPLERVGHPNMRVWIQEPLIPGRHEVVPARYILDGWSHNYRQFLGASMKDMEWFFAGQVTHQRRRDCITALQSIPWGGVIIETKGYCQGVQMSEYARMMQHAWIVPCPSGPQAQDSARPWEALESKSIPILDAYSPVRHEPGFWEKVLGPHPLPVIENWLTLPGVIDDLKHRNLAIVSNECQSWWQGYRMRFVTWLKQDLEALGCTGIKSPF